MLLTKPSIVSLKMKNLAAILFVLGIPWAIIAIFGLFGPLVAFEDVAKAIRRHESRYLWRAAVSLSMFCMTVWGYALWWGGWLSIATGWKNSSRRFWLLAATHHLVWMFLWGCNDRRLNPGSSYSAGPRMVCVLAASQVEGTSRDKAKLGRLDWSSEI